MAQQGVLKQNEDRIWLVKASDVIIGPFTLAELAQQVLTKQIRLLDEARTPSSRWIFVRDIAEIQATISKLAQQEDTFEKTHTAASMNVTRTINLSDDVTPIPTHIPLPPKSSESPKPSPTSKPSIEVPPQPSALDTAVKSYSLNPPNQPIPWGKWGLFAAGFLVAAAGIFLFAQKKSWEVDQKRNWSEFQQYYVAQLYNDAYKKLKEYRREFPDQPTGLTRAGFLYLNPGQELVKARRMFERSSQLLSSDKELMVQNLNGMGLIYLYEGQYKDAKYQFDRALTLEPSNILTRFNLISLAMSQGNWNDAFTLAEQVQAAEPKKAAVIQASVSLLSNQHHDKGRSILINLSRHFDNSSYLRPIMRLLMLRLASLHSDPTNFEAQLKNFFEDIPSFHTVFTETPIIDQRWRDWNFLYQFCSDLKGPPRFDADVLAVQVICTSQIQKWNEAEKMLGEGFKRFPNHPRLFMAQLHLLTSMERWPEVRTLMRTASLTSDYSINWMFAKACLMERNNSCADLYLKPLTYKTPVPTPVYDLQAYRDCGETVSDKCRFSVTQGLAQDPANYSLLKLKFQIEAGYEE
jgi:tetratricopeptide (TPR) repeat protein